MIWRKTLQCLGIAVLLLAIATGALIWNLRSSEECLIFGDSYTPIGELRIDGRRHYVYGAISGFQDKVQTVQISANKLPETLCTAEQMAQHVESVVVEESRVLKKVLVSRKPGGGLALDLEYGAAVQRGTRQNWKDVAIELR